MDGVTHECPPQYIPGGSLSPPRERDSSVPKAARSGAGGISSAEGRVEDALQELLSGGACFSDG